MYGAHQQHAVYFGYGGTATEALTDLSNKVARVEADNGEVVSITITTTGLDADNYYSTVLVVDHSQ